jgi:tRNA-dihydrouridine synthase 1
MTPQSSKSLLAYTPMLHARLFNEKSKFRDNHFQPLRTSLSSLPTQNQAHESKDIYLDGNPILDRPLTVQFCANDPDEFLNAARYVTPFCDAVDLNLGCPQGIARKGKYGAFLQEDQDLIYALINKLHRELDVPVTAKIRILESKEKTLEYARRVLDAGASILTVHGRRREQKGHNTGLADWKVIRFLREELGSEVVLFANGNILQREDVDRCIEETGVDGVMSAEGNLYDPAIFAEPPAVGEEGRDYWRGRDGRGGWRMDAVYRRYMDIIHKHVLEVPGPERRPLYLPSDPVPQEQEVGVGKGEEEGPARKKQKKEKKEKATSPNLLAMQAHSFHLLRALVSKHHNVRDALARCRAGDIEAFENVLQMVEVAVKSGIKEYEETGGRSWEEELERDERLKEVKRDVGEAKKDFEENKQGDEIDERYESSLETVKKCKRPWWVVQPYVRPLPKEALAKGSMTLSKKDKARLENEAAVPSGHTEVEKAVGGKEVEVPKEGLVCG